MSAATVTDQADKADQQEKRQVLTFLLNGQNYGLDLLQVQEIRGLTSITTVPNMPVHIKGVMNLRGAVLPVIDLRAKFGMPLAEYTKVTVIIIARSADKSVGLVADAVSDVLTISADQVHSAPEMGGPVDSRMIQGLLKTADRFAVLLDLERLMSDGEVVSQSLESTPGLAT